MRRSKDSHGRRFTLAETAIKKIKHQLSRNRSQHAGGFPISPQKIAICITLDCRVLQRSAKNIIASLLKNGHSSLSASLRSNMDRTAANANLLCDTSQAHRLLLSIFSISFLVF